MKVTDKGIFSDGWLQNFEKCHGIRKLYVGGEVLSADDEAAEWYSELDHNLVEQHKLLPTQIYNANETELFCSIYNNGTNNCTQVY
jgi:hypothetical protein